MNKLNFLERAAKLGHNVSALEAGQEQESELTIPDIDSLKALFHNSDSSIGQAEMSTIAQTQVSTQPSSSVDEPVSLTHKMQAFLHNNGPLSESDRAMMGSIFPIKIKAVSIPSVTINSPTILGASQQPTLLNYGTITLTDTGIITVQGVSIVLNIDNFIRMGNPPATMGDINILGIKGMDGVPGMKGGNGPDGGPNGNGGNGANGQFGSHATDGLPSQEAIINIIQSVQSSSPIIVYTSTGAGGRGGNGGGGGNGGSGGSASPYPTHGGNGGNGGGGGNGGSSPNANGNVMVYVNSNYINSINGVSVDTPAGLGGDGGPGGLGGSGSYPGQKGDTGAVGYPGSTSGKSANIIIRPY